MRVDYAQVDRFLNFITSSHIIQDFPFFAQVIKWRGNSNTKCCEDVDTTANNTAVLPTLRRDRFHSHEQAHTAPILGVCSASVSKSLQGLDNFSAQGSSAFEDLCQTVD